MNRFICDMSYEQDLAAYRAKIFEKYGFSSQTAEREIMYLADKGNTVAEKLYADMVFYKKISKDQPYREAFSMYMRSAGITVLDGTEWKCSGVSYPLSFWILGYYLVNYGRESVLRNAVGIKEIEALSLCQRFSMALELAVSCVDYVGAPSAVNLVGRILYEVSGDEELFGNLRETITETVVKHDFSGLTTAGSGSSAGRDIAIRLTDCSDTEQTAACAEGFLKAAAELGYVYACNSLAVKEADRIISMKADGASQSQMDSALDTYERYLKLAADKYEPYAANRLGLFYIEGQVKGSAETVLFAEKKNSSLAKVYFTRATIYPDSNSAWAYLNLIKYFRSDYATNLDFLNDHMDRIKELNPKVYDIAMEL